MSTPVSSPVRNPWWVATVSGMASYIDAAAITGAGIAVVLYQLALGLGAGQVGILSGTLTCGIAVGALIGGRLGDRFGRRAVFIATMALVALGAATLALCTGFTLLLAGTALVGFGTGADLPVSLATVAEVSTDENRGKMLGFSQILWSMGIIVPFVASTQIGGLGRLGGQILYGHIAVVAAVVLLARLSIPESPSWTKAHAQEQVPDIASARPQSSLATLVSRDNRAAFVGLLVFYALINLAANTVGQFGTYLLVNVAGASVSGATTITLAMLPVGLLAALAFMRIADGPHRFGFFKLGAVLTVVGQLVPAVLGVNLTTYVVGATIGSIGTAFAGEALMKVWTQESFPLLLRATAQGAVIAVARFSAAALATVTPLVMNAGARYLYFFLAAVCTAGLVSAYLAFRGRDAARGVPASSTDRASGRSAAQQVSPGTGSA